MRNFFKKRRGTQFTEAGSDDMGQDVHFGRPPVGFSPRLVTPGTDPDHGSDPESYEAGDVSVADIRRQPPTLHPIGRPGGRREDEAGDEDTEDEEGRDAPRFSRHTSGPGAATLAEAQEAEAEMPRFSLPVTGLRGAAALPGVTPQVNRQLREAFTPTRPKLEVNSLFVGRLNTLRRIISAIEEERAHVVLYGDRGRGKTSLSNAVQQIAAQAGYFTLKLTCSAELSFEDIFRSFLRRIPGSFYQSQVDNPFSARRVFDSFDELLPPGPFSVTALNDVLSEIQGAHVMLILDEYDRVVSEDLRNKLAELIKNLTDSSAPITLFIIGVAEDVDHLLGKHPSIQRSLVAVHLPLMNDKEIDRIIQAGADTAGLVFSADIRRRIAGFAKGLPYYAQLLSLHAARSAVSRGSSEVSLQDLAYAVARCVQEAERSIVEAYNKALGPDRKASFADVLYVAAQCRSDEYGTFHPADMVQVPVRENGDPLSLLSLQYPLSRLSDDERGGVLQRLAEPGGFRYRFRNQMMRQYVLLRQARDRGLI
jgi:Cdc6-like AAA superfamily ATPase